MKKKLLLMIAMVVLCLAFAMTASALEATGQCGDNVYWDYNQSTKELVISGEGETWSYDYESDMYSPFDNADVFAIVIEEGITVVGDELFISMPVKNVSFPNTLVSIGDRAFTYCDELLSINFNDGLKEIGEEAFSSCEKLSGNLIIPDSVGYIDRYAFQFCWKIENLYIGKGIWRINPYTFNACTGLKNIIINSTLSYTDVGSFAGVHPEHTYFVGESSYIDKRDPRFLGKTLHYNYTYIDNHFCDYVAKEIPSTCTEQGYTIFTCECGYSYTGNYVNTINHSYMLEITKTPTHIETGLKTFTCKCGDSYTESIEKIEQHTYEAYFTEPTCTKQGYTTFTCECGDSYTEPVAKIAHVYNKAVTAPTCTEDGYTTYTCECGDTYKGDIVNKTGHSHTSVVTRPATHLVEGIRTYTCTVCSHSYAESIAKTKDHSYAVSKVVDPSCEDKGYTVYACECGSTKNDNYTDATGHNYDGQTCTKCGKNCSCNCHKTGFMGFIWKITRFFNKLFKTNKTCACGVAHY